MFVRAPGDESRASQARLPAASRPSPLVSHRDRIRFAARVAGAGFRLMGTVAIQPVPPSAIPSATIGSVTHRSGRPSRGPHRGVTAT